MSLQTSGRITLNDIKTEFDQDFRLSTYYGADAGVPSSGKISFSDFYGKSSLFVIKETGSANAFTDANGNFKELNLRNYLLTLGWNGTSAVEWQINPNIYVWSDNNTVPALTIENFPRGITIRNFGFIMGKGGDGRSISALAQDGGPAIRYNNPGIPLVIINENTGHIGGGGGGGAGISAGEGDGSTIVGGGGGGAGGGRGGSAINNRHGNTTPFANGGTLGNFGSNGAEAAAPGGRGGSAGGSGGNFVNDGFSKTHSGHSSGGGGGRIMPGAITNSTGNGGTGGSTSTGGTASDGAGGGGGWGSPGGSAAVTNATTGSPGAGGKAVDVVAGSVLVSAGASRIYGAIS